MEESKQIIEPEIDNELVLDDKWKKIIKRIVIAIVIVVILTIASITFYNYYSFKNKRQYQGIITEITFPENRKGLPMVKIDTTTYYLYKPEKKVFSSLQIGDSIVKETGSLTIKLYHKENDGKWKEMIFE